MPARAPAGAVLLEAAGVAVALGGRRVVEDVDLAVRAGEVVVLVGPNGAGKSTLLGALAGDLAVAAGEVRVDGRPLAGWSVSALARRRAVLPQHVAVAFPFTVEDVVRMGRAPLRGTDAEVDEDGAVDGALAALELDHLRHRPMPRLSGGERARVAMARILVQGAQLMLLDEPTAALDLHHQELLLAVVRARADAGDAAVVVLHDLSVAASHADRVVVLGERRVVADGPPGEVVDAGLLGRIYQHPVSVVDDPATGSRLVVPHRIITT
ncbi:MAG: heme ABC transporter ATP-binding protein [Acidimicrobiia bacterium]